MHHKWFAVVWAMLPLQPYPQRCRFTVYNNHNAHKCTFHLQDSREELTHWRLRISEFKSNGVHGAGNKQVASDVIPKMRTVLVDETPIEDDIRRRWITPSGPEKRKDEVHVGARR